MVEKAIYDLLTNSTGVTSVVSSRIYNGTVPQETDMPFVMFRRERTQRYRTLDGPNGLVEADFEVNCVGLRAGQLLTLADEIRQALDNYSATVAGIDVHRIMLDDESEELEVEVSGGEEMVRRRALDFRVWYYETAATN